MKRFISILLLGLCLLPGGRTAGQNGAAQLASYLPVIIGLPAFHVVPTMATFNAVTDITNAGDDRLFVTERDGLIQILHPSDAVTTFMDLRSKVIIESPEMGMLALAFHPDYATNGHFFVSYTGSLGGGGDRWLIVSRFTVTADANVADPASETRVLSVKLEETRDLLHIGGGLAFSPLDGYLYAGVGDNSRLQVAQEEAHLGKILQLNVEEEMDTLQPAPGQPGVMQAIASENWVWGLRNPWRFDFDPGTGDLYIADVGDREWEEIDFVPGGSWGHNFGWPCMEGYYEPPDIAGICDDDLSPYELPVYAYTHAEGCAIIGGKVIKRPDRPVQFIFGDGCSRVIYALSNTGGWPVEMLGALPDTAAMLTTFGLDSKGGLYAGTLAAPGPIYWVHIP